MASCSVTRAGDTSFFNLSFRRVGWHDVLMGADADFVGRMGPQLELLLPLLDEKSRRLVLGAVARAAGNGGVTAVAAATGAGWQTVADGAADLVSGEVPPPGRSRRPGGGRKRLEDHDPRLTAAMRGLLEESSRGDPMSLLLLAAVQGERHRAGCDFAGGRGFRGGSGCGGVACDDTVSVSDMGRPSP